MKHLMKISVLIAALVFFFAHVGMALATGNIVANQNYSQFMNIDLDNNGTNDFINWSPTTGGATVGDSTLTGDIWGETVGWINLNPTYGGVTNTCSGVLGGYAWGQNTGWINFAPTYATGANQPKINTTTGQITGTVWSQNYGWIQLSSPQTPAGTSYNPSLGLETTWHGCTSGSGSGSGGGGSGTTTGGSCTPPYVMVGGVCTAPTTPPSTGSSSSATTTPVIPSNPIIPPGSGGVTGPTTPPPIITPPTSPTGTIIPPVSPSGNGNHISGTQTTSTGTLPLVSVFGNPLGFEATNRSLGWLGPLLALIGLLSSLPGLIGRFGSMFLTFVFGSKKRRGIVYDSKTKEPLDPAYVSVIDVATGREVANQFTDIEGRFGFILKKGSYRLSAAKTHYIFPSAMLAGKSSDEVYDSLYFGDVFTVENEQEIFTMNVPMDAVGADWNQQEKHRINMVRYFIENQKAWGWLLDTLFVIGFVVSIAIAYYNPVWWNALMVCLYVVLTLVRLFGYGPVSIGTVTKNGFPLQYAVIRVYSVSLNHEVAHKVTNDRGSYYILVAKGNYYITVEEKNQDGSYTKIFTSTAMHVPHGVISKSFDL